MEPAIFSSNKISHIGSRIKGFTPKANSPTYLAPSSVSRILLIASLLFEVASIIFPSLNTNLTFLNSIPFSTDGVLYVITPFILFLTGAVYISPSGIFLSPEHFSLPIPLMLNDKSVSFAIIRTLSVFAIKLPIASIALSIFA